MFGQLVAATLAGCLYFAAIRGQQAMAGPKVSWFQLAPHPHNGSPHYVRSPGHSRAHREALRQLSRHSGRKQLDEIERELAGALSGVEREQGYSYSDGDSWTVWFDAATNRAVMRIEYDLEAEMEDRYPSPPLSAEMPLSEFAELFFAWNKSMRHWNSLGGFATPPPPERWPKSYPPSDDT